MKLTHVCQDVVGDVLGLDFIHDLHLELQISAIGLSHQLDSLH